MARLEESEIKSTDSVSIKDVLGGAELISPITDITLSVPVDIVNYCTSQSWYGSSSYRVPKKERSVYKYNITLEEAEQIYHALRDSIAQAKIVKTLIEDNVI